ncbi:sugar phosphate isomerase/epimerase family protein [Paenibacillus alginolyticus]|uniref:TIM barrel protein n=1 Tax=Paenibacillus alginolyticus TaxID=59839 RepID=A0ABT4GAM3_9BACL|nr:TIM barrel protein [Paenibacillus alginolyticus]MCY9693227.1 TIM barrel protein [Paenibacillus alginolyticus]MEC0146004.1 TIM barrel protein [Paenibacillus alginolyticus]
MNKISRDQIAGMNFHYKHHSLTYFLDAMVRYGFKHIELWGASPHIYVEGLTQSELRKVKQEIELRDLEVVCFTPEQCVYPINIAAKEDGIRTRSIDYFNKSLEVAKELGAPLLLVTPGWGYEHEPIDEAWKRSQDSLAKITVKAAELNVVLALEPLTRMESNLVTNIATLQKMLGEVNSPFLKGMIDTIPMALTGEDFQGYFNAMKNDIVHIHFIDGKPEGHLVWGDGVLPLETYIEQLVTIGYKGYLTLEYTSYSYIREPDKAIEKTLKILHPYIS